jgi:hypothetical protein
LSATPAGERRAQSKKEEASHPESNQRTIVATTPSQQSQAFSCIVENRTRLNTEDSSAASVTVNTLERGKQRSEEKKVTQTMDTQNKQLKVTAAKQATKERLLACTGSAKDVPAHIGSGDVRFLSLEWLLGRPDSWRVARCQDLPKEAFIDGEEAVRLYDRLGGLVIVSAPWLTKGHPDPQGFHSHSLLLYLRIHQRHFMRLVKSAAEGFSDIGVFWDYASLMQPSTKNGERTTQEQHLFSRGMRTIEYLYGGPMTAVVQLKQMPYAAFENMNRTPYDSRGWCYFEEYMACTMKSSFQVLNLALVVDQLEERNCEWQLLASAAQNEKKPPMHPEQMKQELITRTFSAKEDFDLLLHKYTEHFQRLASSTLEISLPQQAHIASARPWGTKEVEYLVRALPAFSSCMKLNLRGRALGDIGAEKLAKSLPAATCLETVWLDHCDIGNKGISALAPALRELKDLVDLRLHGSRFTAAGLRELCDIAFFPFMESKEVEANRDRSIMQLSKLEDLTLPLELAKTAAADVLNRLVGSEKVMVSRLMVKWM